MNNVDPNLTGFDFCWSSCALEHLGSLRAGMDFIIRSIETLRPGGIAIHTTEYNVESDDETLDNNWTVLYRRMDMNVLQAELTALGHTMEPFTVAPVLGPMDVHVDMPPYLHNPHLKLLLEGHVTTSCGIIVRRGS
jgi:hypothetical protein